MGAAAFAVSAGGRLAPLADAGAAAGVLLLATGIVLRRPGTIVWAVLLEGGAYLAGRADHSTVDGWSALIGALLLLAAELATWSVEHDARIGTERALMTRRVVTLAALISAALTINVLLLGMSALSAPAGLFVASAGVAAAVASVALVVRLVRP